MTELLLQFDEVASKSLDDLMTYYGTESKAEVISKGLAILKIASYVHRTNGELVARKGHHETKIIVR